MLDLLVIWGHSSDDSISNPQVWRNRACKHAGLYPAFFKSGHLFPSSCLPLHHLLFFPSPEHPCFLDYYFERDFMSVVFVFLSISRSCSQPVGKQKKKNSNRNLMEAYMGSPSVAWGWVTGSESCDSHCPSRK